VIYGALRKHRTALEHELRTSWPGVRFRTQRGTKPRREFEDHVAVFAGRVRAPRRQYVVATKGAALHLSRENSRLEFFMTSAEPFPKFWPTLHAVAFAHATLAGSGEIGVVSDLGEPWHPLSEMSHLYFSPPYCLPAGSWHPGGDADVHWCWVVPITDREYRFALANGADALEEALEKAQAPIGAMARTDVV